MEEKKGTEARAATPYQFQKEYQGDFVSVKFIVLAKDRQQVEKMLTEFAATCHTCYLEMAAEINRTH